MIPADKIKSEILDGRAVPADPPKIIPWSHWEGQQLNIPLKRDGQSSMDLKIDVHCGWYVAMIDFLKDWTENL